jgi:hypothetical protein
VLNVPYKAINQPRKDILCPEQGKDGGTHHDTKKASRKKSQSYGEDIWGGEERCV